MTACTLHHLVRPAFNLINTPTKVYREGVNYSALHVVYRSVNFLRN